MTDDELNQLHEFTMQHLYKIFEEEFDAYFRFKEASMNILGYGRGTFPFSTRYDCAMNHIEKTLEVIESNIIDHIEFQLKHIYDERSPSDYSCKRSEALKKELSEKIGEHVRKK